MTIRKPDGSRLASTIRSWIPSGTRWPAWACRSFIHTGEPEAFFQPLTSTTNAGSSWRLFHDRAELPARPGHVRGAAYPSATPCSGNIPKTQFIVAHFGWHANNLGRLARLLDAYPNVVTEMGAVLYDLGRQPRAAHDFFVKYQDRILFGKDAYAPTEFPYLLARAGNEGRVLRLLPRLPRLLEAVRDGPAGRRAPEGVPPERAAGDAGSSTTRLVGAPEGAHLKVRLYIGRGGPSGPPMPRRDARSRARRRTRRRAFGR